MNDDGTVPKDNPFVGTPGAVPTIWSYGHRNPQGLAWDPVTGKLWESEHGPNSADEINLIEKGHNYGWGVATKAVQAGMVPSAPGMDDPLLYYTPSMATAGISFYTGNRYPGWKNTSLFVGGLVGQRLERLEITKDKVTKQEVMFDTFGRVRDIVQGPDGYFYIVIQNPTGGASGVALSAATPGKLIRLMPSALRTGRRGLNSALRLMTAGWSRHGSAGASDTQLQSGVRMTKGRFSAGVALVATVGARRGAALARRRPARRPRRGISGRRR